jgi:hypothetical protein
MKTAGKISILLNVVLFGVLILLLTNQRPAASQAASIIQPATLPIPAAKTTIGIEASSHVNPAPFRWNQLDSKDYHIYVKNLRAIGCPEPTVRAIVAADVHSVYKIFGDQIEKKLSDLSVGSWTNQLVLAGSEQALKSDLQHLPDEEAAKIADLLGESPISSDHPASVVAAIPMVAPLALQPLDFAAVKLDPQQIQAINDLRQSFIAKIGGSNQDTNNLAYQKLWQQLQTENDEIMVGIVGEGAFQDLQLQVLANSQTSEVNSTRTQ